MSLRMVSLWIVGALLVAATLKADPPQAEPAEIANQVKDQAVTPKPVPVGSADKRQVQFDVKVWDVDHASLRALTKADVGVHEFYKANGLIRQPDWISAAIGDAIGDLLAPPGRKVAAPAPLPVRAFAVRDKPVSKTLLGQDISSALKTIAEPSLVGTNGREATMLSGGEMPIFVPRSGDPEVIGWHEYGLKMKILPRLMDKGRIALGLDFEFSQLHDPKSDTGDSSIRLISSQGFRLSAQMKLGEQLLVAQQIGKQDVTRLVQIQATLVTEQPVAAKSSDDKTTRLENGIDVTQTPQEGNQSLQNHPSAKIEIQSSGGGTKVTAAGPPDEIERAIDSAKNVLPVTTRLRHAAPENADDVSYQLAPDSTGERGGVSPPVERDRANGRGADAAPFAKSQVAEPQRVRPRKAARDVPSKSAELQRLRDEIRELRQEVRELIQRLDREQAAPAAQQLPMPQPGHTGFAPAPQVPLAKNDEAVADKVWRMLGLRVAPLTESERKSLHPKYQGGMKVIEVRRNKLSPENGIRKNDILVGLHVWETTSFENLRFVLDHPQLAKLDSLKFYLVRGTETLYGHLNLLEPPKLVPEAKRSEPLPRSRSIALADLPMKLVTEFDKIKLHIEVDRALVETAADARGIKVTDDEVNQYLRHLQVQSKTDQVPFAVFLQGLKLMPLFSQFYEATRQQLALVKFSGQAHEPTDEELQDAYRLAQAGRVGRRRFAFPDKAKALEAARDIRLNLKPKPIDENAQNHWVTDWQGSGSLIPTVPPQPAEEAIAKLQEGEVSDVIQEGDHFAIYQRLSVLKPKGTFDDLKPQLRATLILNKTNEISLREIEQLRKAYRLIVVPAHDPPKIAEPGAAVPTRTPNDRRWPLRLDVDSPSTPTARNLGPLLPQPETIGITESGR